MDCIVYLRMAVRLLIKFRQATQLYTFRHVASGDCASGCTKPQHHVFPPQYQRLMLPATTPSAYFGGLFFCTFTIFSGQHGEDCEDL